MRGYCSAGARSHRWCSSWKWLHWRKAARCTPSIGGGEGLRHLGAVDGRGSGCAAAGRRVGKRLACLALRGSGEAAQQYLCDIQRMLDIYLSLSSVSGVVLRHQDLKKLAGDAEFHVCGHWSVV